MQQRHDDRLPLALVEWKPVGRIVFEAAPDQPRVLEFGEAGAARQEEAELVTA